MKRAMAAVAVIVASWNTRNLLAECLASVAECSGTIDLETVVVDNGSSDGSPAMVRERFPDVRLIVNRQNLGFARANNQAVAATSTPYILMLNSDARLAPAALRHLLDRIAAAPRAGIVGAQLRFPDGSFQFSHARFPSLAREALILSGLGRLVYGPWYPSVPPHADSAPRVVEWVSGACMLARRAAFDAVRGFDENYFFYGEEMDLCYRLRAAGWEVWYEPAAEIFHHGAASSSRMHAVVEERLYRGRLQFFRNHYGAAATRALAAELCLFTPPKIALHAVLRGLSGGRVGRQVISPRALGAAVRASLGGVSSSPGHTPAAAPPPTRGDAARAASTLIVATAVPNRASLADVTHEYFPRTDYVELCNRIDGEVLDYGAYPAGRAGQGFSWLETQLRSDPYLACLAMRRSRHHARVLCMSERAGIPLAALRRVGAYERPLAVLFQAWSPRQEAAMTRFGLFDAIDIVGVNSTAMRDHLIDLGVAPTRLRVLQWAVDHRFFAPAGGNGAGAFALALGEARGRDYPLLFTAIDGLPIELQVLVSGYHAAREKRPAAFARVPDNVALRRHVPSGQLRQLYGMARFVVLPVNDVIYPAGVTAALEAMSMARAVIATRSRGMRDYLVEGETCLLVEPGDVAGMRAAIERLVKDPALARRLGENGRARVEAGLNQQHYVAQLADLVHAWAG
jgi:GT2 family glycosyltransferase/glycosyltransferase involved in cell wall biosynthesis